MPAILEPLRMTDGQIDESGAVLSRAFFDDPLLLYILPDEEQRRVVLPWFMSCGVRGPV